MDETNDTDAKYVLEVVPQEKQRYDTPGDWIPGKPARIVSSKMEKEDYEFLILLHELIECHLCKKKGITDEAVVEFDKKFEEDRKEGKHSAMEEPGNSPQAPYRDEHVFATKLEREMAKKLGVDWRKYSEAVHGVTEEEAREEGKRHWWIFKR
jgi:hypothetical protein